MQVELEETANATSLQLPASYSNEENSKCCFSMFLADHYIYKDMFAFLDTDDSFDVQPRDIADIIKKSVNVDEDNKMQIINNRVPQANFKFPERHYADKSRKTEVRSLYCQAS